MKASEHKERRAVLSDKIKFSVFNNLFLALVLLGVGALINHKLENIRSHDSFTAEFNKIKAQKIGESWAELSEWEARVDILFRVWLESEERLKNSTWLPSKQEMDEYSKLYEGAIGYEKIFMIERNRFWVGKEQYYLMGDFAALVSRKVENYTTYNQDSIIIINKLIDEKRLEIDAVVTSILERQPTKRSERPKK